ncbi:sulfurtransferase [Gorillibacterium sp. sgz500922]|uniref:sulfurtransferase n=1 Tax=Gorillibacterium sp. sgz500922 TaxID=3446694 RepID=UPI003F667546
MTSTVSIEWVKEHITCIDLIPVDCRFLMGQPEAGRAAYEAGHLPGAVYFDLEKDLSLPISPHRHGGRHPLPDPQTLAEKFGAAGIGPESRVVVYDDQGGAMASRMWWLLRYYGHRHVVVMDGGFGAWAEAGYELDTRIPEREPQQFTPRLQPGWIAERDEVMTKRLMPGTVLIDSREPDRYMGLTEPIDPIAGHIPGAVNHYWKDGLDAAGRWKDRAGQRERFVGIPLDREIIVYCGSGVTACPNVMALKEAGFPHVKLYPGSWSDWISYDDSPIATGEQPNGELEGTGA